MTTRIQIVIDDQDREYEPEKPWTLNLFINGEIIEDEVFFGPNWLGTLEEAVKEWNRQRA